MAKYNINDSEITGVKGISMFKNQIIDEVKFVDGSIDNLLKCGSISAVEEVAKVDKKIVEVPKKAE